MLIALAILHLFWLSEIVMLGFICRLIALHGLSLPAILGLMFLIGIVAYSQTILKSLRQSYRDIKVMRQLTAALSRENYQGWLDIAAAHQDLNVVKESLPLVRHMAKTRSSHKKEPNGQSK